MHPASLPARGPLAKVLLDRHGHVARHVRHRRVELLGVTVVDERGSARPQGIRTGFGSHCGWQHQDSREAKFLDGAERKMFCLH